MRPPRIAILVFFFAACLFLLCRSITSAGRTTPHTASTAASTPPRSGFRSFFSFSTPFTLFPPNAIISIAEDNSTSFAARPAAFGPPLPSRGLRGQLWIGSGFTEESLLQENGGSDGEFGCSDAPGWDGSSMSVLLKGSSKTTSDKAKAGTSGSKVQSQKRDAIVDRTAKPITETKPKSRPVDDGTDDYLHQPFQPGSKSQDDAFALSNIPAHADIQSIQEAAEIAGKIVLLSRGGCGFLDKVKWAQRRGAIGVIVGDNERGGPLIQMYARGDTSNVTIPSIFTSRTTAYLLSSLMQPGSYIEDIIDENGKPSAQLSYADKSKKPKKGKSQSSDDKSTDSKSSTNARSASTKSNMGSSSNSGSSSSSSSEPPAPRQSWFSWLFGSSSRNGERSRPPSSGQLDWVLVDDFSDEKDKIIRNSLEKAAKGADAKSTENSNDDFQIGIEDWRDPDLVGSSSKKEKLDSSSSTSSKATAPDPKSKPASKADTKSTADGKKAKDPNGPKGGSITPGSGEYTASSPAKGKSASDSKADKPKHESSDDHSTGILSKLFGDDSTGDSVKAAAPAAHPIKGPIPGKPAPGEGTLPDEDQGLWVVITPSSGASPFFDTLIVLVISPLITLTVVYALLIIRARIRRRRWRAPKSVVDRLPVRTYHTVAVTPSASPRLSRSPCPSPPSPTTPLLQSQHGPSRPRPRSRTTTGVAGDLLQVNTSLQVPKSPPREKPSEWKKYMGRQVECVVCLEEYVDGVSQVMSLPCGHEFHVECITPWLTTRRRTCPICKGDVVRSLARGSPSSPRYEPYRDDSDDDFGMEGTSSSSANSGAAGGEEEDIEQGILSPVPQRRHRQEGWLTALSRSFREASSSSSRSRSRERSRDRDR